MIPSSLKFVRFNHGFAQIPVLVVLSLLTVALPVATALVNRNQDTRNLAAGTCTSGPLGYITCPDGSRAKQYRRADCSKYDDCPSSSKAKKPTSPPKTPTSAPRTPTSPPKPGTTGKPAPTSAAGKCTAGTLGYITCPDGSRALQYRDANCNITDDCSSGSKSSPTKSPNPTSVSNPGSTPPPSGKCTSGTLGYTTCPDGSRALQYRDANCNITNDCKTSPPTTIPGRPTTVPSGTKTCTAGYTGYIDCADGTRARQYRDDKCNLSNECPTGAKPSPGDSGDIPPIKPGTSTLKGTCSGGYPVGATAIGPSSKIYQCRPDGLWHECSYCPLNVVPQYVKESEEMIQKYIVEPLNNQNIINEFLLLSKEELAKKYCGSNTQCLAAFTPEKYLQQIQGITLEELSELSYLRTLMQTTPTPTRRPTNTPRPTSTPVPTATTIPTVTPSLRPSPTASGVKTPTPTRRISGTVSPTKPVSVTPARRITVTPTRVLSPPDPGVIATGIPGKKCTAGSVGTCTCPNNKGFCKKMRDENCNIRQEGCYGDNGPTPYPVGSRDWTYYSQRDGQWANKPIDGGRFVNSGCGPTTSAMLLCTYSPASCTDPYTFQQQNFPNMSAASGPNFGTSVTENTNSLRNYGFNPQFINPTPEEIKRYTDMGIPVMVSVNTSVGNHITVITGVDANGNLIAQDPYFGSNVNLNKDPSVGFGGINDAAAIYPPK